MGPGLFVKSPGDDDAILGGLSWCGEADAPQIQLNMDTTNPHCKQKHRLPNSHF